MSNTGKHRKTLERYWREAVSSVAGDVSVERAMKQFPGFRPDQVIAIGKAADSMCAGALKILGNDPKVLIVRKRGFGGDAILDATDITVFESGHPIPDEVSLAAGKALMDTVANMNPDSRLLMLVSGGASALAEHPVDGVSLADLRRVSNELIDGGLSIDQINEKRTAMSRIKGGRLLGAFSGSEVVSCLISDVPGDDVQVIGSGIGRSRLVPSNVREYIVANNFRAREVVAVAAANDGEPVQLNEESLHGDIDDVAERLAMTLDNAEQGVYVWGGEPGIRLPDAPGKGGRNLSLALSLAIRICGRDDVGLIVAGTDGDDGTSGVAGAFVDGSTVADPESAIDALVRADAYSWFCESGCLFDIGPTGTNVMDLAIAMVGQRPVAGGI